MQVSLRLDWELQSLHARRHENHIAAMTQKTPWHERSISIDCGVKVNRGSPSSSSSHSSALHHQRVQMANKVGRRGADPGIMSGGADEEQTSASGFDQRWCAERLKVASSVSRCERTHAVPAPTDGRTEGMCQVFCVERWETLNLLAACLSSLMLGSKSWHVAEAQSSRMWSFVSTAGRSIRILHRSEEVLITPSTWKKRRGFFVIVAKKKSLIIFAVLCEEIAGICWNHRNYLMKKKSDSPNTERSQRRKCATSQEVLRIFTPFYFKTL